MTAALPLARLVGAEAIDPIPDCCRRCRHWTPRGLPLAAVGTCTNDTPIHADSDITRAGWTTCFAYVCPAFEAIDART